MLGEFGSRGMGRLLAAALLVLTAGAVPAGAETINVAVAANFTGPAKIIAKAFEAKTGDTVRLSFGATGGLFAQISQGAPFDIFLAADRARPEKAVEAGLAVKDSLFTYALGQLVLYAPGMAIADGPAVLKAQTFEKLAVANPKAAPYGAAGVAVLKALHLYEALRPKLVFGANVSQTLQFVQTGNAELGFVALSQVQGEAKANLWQVPTTLYPPIEQGAVLLQPGAGSDAASAFLAFLKSPEGHAMIRAAGYEVVPSKVAAVSKVAVAAWPGMKKPIKDCRP